MGIIARNDMVAAKDMDIIARNDMVTVNDMQN